MRMIWTNLVSGVSNPVFPMLVIALGLAVLIGLSALYFRTAASNVNLARLKMIAKTKVLGNTTAMLQYQNRIMKNPFEWSEYDDDTTLYEPPAIKERVLWPSALCILTVFAMTFILFVAFEWGYYTRPGVILGGAYKVGSPAQSCLVSTDAQECPEMTRAAVSEYQLGSLEVIQFSFLAAYVWSLWQIFQRMIARDVTVYAFHVITIRIITTVVLALTLYQLFGGEALLAGTLQPAVSNTFIFIAFCDRLLSRGGAALAGCARATLLPDGSASGLLRPSNSRNVGFSGACFRTRATLACYRNHAPWAA
jgi:hypothetical protein